MTKRMDEILKWYKDMLYTQKREIHTLKKEIKKLKEKDLINKIDELATTDKSSTVDWQVGDQICAHYHIDTIPDEGELKRYLSILRDPRWTTPLNISAALRAKDKEIAALRKELQKDPWCYDMDKAHKSYIFWVKGGTFNCVTQKHGMKLDNPILVYYFEQSNPDVDTPYRCAIDLSVGIDNPTAWMPIPEPKGIGN